MSLIIRRIPSLLIVLMLFVTTCLAQQHKIALWEGEIPLQSVGLAESVQDLNGIQWIEQVQEPALEVYLPNKRTATRQAVIICPGGGYKGLAYDWEGTDIAKWLNARGIAGIVLKYRLPDPDQTDGHKIPMIDAKRAIQLVRYYAEAWNISKDDVGIMGFSAGGHLAASAATHLESGYESGDDISELSDRPDFLILLYPVISMKKGVTHGGSRNNLLGEAPSEEMVNLYSNELQVSGQTPPAFLVHSMDDTAVPVANSLLFHQALIAASVSAELHVYPYGGHGFGLALNKGHLASWTDRLADWLVYLQEQ